MRKLAMIVALDSQRAIGKEGSIPWHIREDLLFFKQKTLGHCVLMGRKTYESIGKPLPKRINLVLTQQKDFKAEGCLVFYDLLSALSFAWERDEMPFIIGGSSLYQESFSWITDCFLTEIHQNAENADTFLPILDLSSFELIETLEHPEKKCTWKHYTLKV